MMQLVYPADVLQNVNAIKVLHITFEEKGKVNLATGQDN
jgi:hypothetical protein